MIIHILNKEEINELKFIISSLKSKDIESILLANSLLKQYPYTMMSIFDNWQFSKDNWHFRQIGYAVENKALNKSIKILEEIIEDEKYCSTEDERGIQSNWYDEIS